MIIDRSELLSGNATLPKLMAYWAEHKPDAVAFRKKEFGIWRGFTWKDYYNVVRRFAMGLRALGFQRGQRLVVASEDSPEWLFAELATHALGGTCIGLYPTNPWQELTYLLVHSQSTFIVCGDQEQTDKVMTAMEREGDKLRMLKKIICVDMKGMRHYKRDNLMSFEDVLHLGDEAVSQGGDDFKQLVEATDPDDIAIIVYTSGTTGHPKGAMLSHRNVICLAAQMREHYKFHKSHEVLCYMPLCHVAERVIASVMQLVNGSIINFAESMDTVSENLREIAPHSFLGVPRIWEKMRQGILIRSKDCSKFQQYVLKKSLELGTPIAERQLANGGKRASLRDEVLFFLLWMVCFRSLQKHFGLNRARFCFSGAAGVPKDQLLFLWTVGLPVYQMYGATEMGGPTNAQRPGYTKLGYAGPPFVGIEQRVDQDGEVLVRAPSVFRGYLFDEESTRAVFTEDGFYRSGDIAVQDPSGEISIIDRKKDIMITSGGKNITPSLIEDALRESTYIREAILIGEGRHFVSALIQIEFDTVGQWAREQGLTYTTYRSLAENPQVHELIEREVEKANQRFARVERVRKFIILKKELDHDDGELTATMKVRRGTVETKFADEIRQIYGGN